METERISGSCQGHRTGIQSHAAPGHSRSSEGEEPSRKGRHSSHCPEAAAVRDQDGGRELGQRARCRLHSHSCPSGTWQGTWGKMPQPILWEPLPLTYWPPFLPLSHHVPGPVQGPLTRPPANRSSSPSALAPQRTEGCMLGGCQSKGLQPSRS